MMILFFVAACACLSASQEITDGPSDKTVFRGRDAVFSCVVRDAPGHWILNDTNFDDLPGALRDDLFHDSVSAAVFYYISLRIPGRVEYNGTRVKCAIENLESESAVLRIQGLLEAVGSVVALNNNSSITVSWTAPFSLDVTGVDPDIWYSVHVLVYNVTDENNPTSILCTDCINITETHYTFTPDYLSPCHVYNFSVIPLNGVGPGESTNHSTFLHGHVVSDDTGLLMDEAIIIDVFEQSRDAFQILITAPLFVNGTVLCFLGHFTLWYYNSDQEKCPGVVSVVFPELISGEGMVVWQIESQVVLGKDCDYTVSITSHSGARETNSSGSFSISTRVLIVEVVEVEGEVVVRCVFRHTLSQRCYVQLVSSEVEGGFQEGGCVEGEGEGVRRFSGLLPATYTVLVYGLAAVGGEDSCSPAPGDPDFITVATVHRPVTTPVTSQRPETTRSLEFPSSSSPLCAEGVGVGACMGAVTTCLLFVVGIITVKMLSKYKQRKRKETESSAHSQQMPMERNMAYELHKPRLPRRKRHTGPQPCSATPNPIYEDLK